MDIGSLHSTDSTPDQPPKSKRVPNRKIGSPSLRTLLVHAAGSFLPTIRKWLTHCRPDQHAHTKPDKDKSQEQSRANAPFPSQAQPLTPCLLRRRPPFQGWPRFASNNVCQIGIGERGFFAYAHFHGLTLAPLTGSCAPKNKTKIKSQSPRASQVIYPVPVSTPPK